MYFKYNKICDRIRAEFIDVFFITPHCPEGCIRIADWVPLFFPHNFCSLVIGILSYTSLFSSILVLFPQNLNYFSFLLPTKISGKLLLTLVSAFFYFNKHFVGKSPNISQGKVLQLLIAAHRRSHSFFEFSVQTYKILEESL